MILHVAVAVTLVALVGLLLAEWKQVRLGVWVCKPLASVGFCVVAWASGALATLSGTVVLVALVLSLVGDVLLIPHSKASFLVGLFAFLGGHVAFAAAFYLHGVSVGWTVVAAAILLGLLLVIGRWLLPQVDRKMRGPVVAYMLVLSTMVALAAGTVGAGARPLVLVGAVAFYVSDLSVAIDRFVRRAFANRLWGLPLYYGAQLLFALSVGW